MVTEMSSDAFAATFMPFVIDRLGVGSKQWDLEKGDYLLDIIQQALDHTIGVEDLNLDLEDSTLTRQSPLYRAVSCTHRHSQKIAHIRAL